MVILLFLPWWKPKWSRDDHIGQQPINALTTSCDDFVVHGVNRPLYRHEWEPVLTIKYAYITLNNWNLHESSWAYYEQWMARIGGSFSQITDRFKTRTLGKESNYTLGNLLFKNHNKRNNWSISMNDRLINDEVRIVYELAQISSCSLIRMWPTPTIKVDNANPIPALKAHPK